jgi:hypothetical protein
MKAFLAAMLAMVAITVGADLLLDRAGFSAADVYSLESVRLGQ